MLWAQFGPPNGVQKDAFWAGVAVAVLASSCIPLLVGGILSVVQYTQGRRQLAGWLLGATGLGVVVTGGSALLCGCLGGLPVAAMCVAGIVVLAFTWKPDGGRPRREYDEDDYDEPRRRRPMRRRRYDEIEDEEEERDSRRARGDFKDEDEDDRPGWKKRYDEIDEHDRRQRRRDYDG